MAQNDPNPTQLPSRRSRWRVWTIGVPTAIAVLFVLIVFVLPTPLARHVIDSQLAALGIAHEGVDSIDIDLWNGRVRAGPIRFHGGETRAGEIGNAGFDYRLGAIFEGRALITNFSLSGVDLQVERRDDGSIVLNGVDLKALAENPGGDAPGAAAAERPDAAFQAGVESFEFTDSTLSFQDVTGGELTMDLQRLTLERLRTWTPQEPTAFSLEARINEMAVSLDGTVLPLTEPLRVTLNTRIEDVTLERVARFVGPTGLIRQDGRLVTEVHYDYEIHRDGRAEGTVEGSYRLSGVDLETASGERVTLDEALLEVDLRQALAADGGATSAAGKLQLSGSKLSMTGASGDVVEVAGVALSADDLGFVKEARKRERLFGFASTPGGGGADARVPSVIELLLGWLRDLGREALGHYLQIDGKPHLELTGVALHAPARDGAPALRVAVDDVTLSLGDVASEAIDAGWNATAAVTAGFRGLRVDGDEPVGQITLSAIDATAGNVTLAVSARSTTLEFDLKSALRQFEAARPDGTLRLGELSLGSGGVSIKGAGGQRSASGPIALTLEALAFTGTDAQGGGIDSLTLSSLSLASDGLTVEESGEERRARGPLALELGALSMSGPDPPPGAGGAGLSLTLDGLSLGTGGLAVEAGRDRRRIGGPVLLKIGAFSFTAPDAGAKAAAQLLELDLATLTLSGHDTVSASVGGTLRTEGLSLARGGQRPLALRIGTASSGFERLEVAPLDAAARIEGGLSARLGEISAESGNGDDAIALTLASLDARLDRLLAHGFETDKPRVEFAGRAELGRFESKGAFGEGLRASASLESLLAPVESFTLDGDSLRVAADLDAGGLALRTEGEPTQSVAVRRITAKGLDTDAARRFAAAEISVDALHASLTRTGDPRKDDADDTASDGGVAVKLGKLMVSPGSQITLTDATMKPALTLDLILEELTVGPVDTATPSTRTEIAFATAVNESARAALNGWATLFADAKDLDLKARVDRLALHALSPYAASTVGVDLESGVLRASVDATAAAGALDGKIDLRIDELFVVPISEENARALQASIGFPVGFAVSVLKDAEGRIQFAMPLSGTVDSPQVDYSEAINKAVTGAIANVLPTGWFGPDGNTFKMEPATFAAGTLELTPEGRSVADQIAELIGRKQALQIRACGRAARADLFALRGGPPAADAATAAAGAPAATSAAGDRRTGPSPVEPDEREVAALLDLAKGRGAAIREYLTATHGIAPDRLPECRTAYSMKEGNQPRAEFQF